MKNLLSHLPFIRSHLEQAETDRGLKKAEEALKTGDTTGAVQALRETAFAEKDGVRWVVGLPFYITSEGVRVIERIKFKYPVLAKFTPAQTERLTALTGKLATPASPDAVALLEELNGAAQAYGPAAAADFARAKIETHVQELMGSDPEKGFDAVDRIHANRRSDTLEGWRQLVTWKEENLTALIAKNHARGMRELGALICQSDPATTTRALFVQHIDDPALFAPRTFMWAAMTATGIDWNSGEKPIELLPAQTLGKIEEKLAAGFTPDPSDTAKADAALNDALTLLPAVEEWAAQREGEKDYPLNSEAQKLARMIHGSVSAYFNGLAEKDPSAAIDRLIRTAASFARNPVYVANLATGAEMKGEIMPSAANLLVTGFNAVAGYVGRHVAEDAKALGLVRRVEQAQDIPAELRDFARATREGWESDIAKKPPASPGPGRSPL